jgi:hypothetical protein
MVFGAGKNLFIVWISHLSDPNYKQVFPRAKDHFLSIDGTPGTINFP